MPTKNYNRTSSITDTENERVSLKQKLREKERKQWTDRQFGEKIGPWTISVQSFRPGVGQRWNWQDPKGVGNTSISSLNKHRSLEKSRMGISMDQINAYADMDEYDTQLDGYHSADRSIDSSTTLSSFTKSQNQLIETQMNKLSSRHYNKLSNLSQIDCTQMLK